MSFTPSRPMGYACLILSMSLVGAYVALSKPLVAVLPLFLLAWLRFAIGAVAMLRWMKKPPGEQALSTQSRWLLFLESFLGNFLFSICMITGVSMTSAVSAGVIMSAIPAVVALMSWLLLKERIGPRIWAAIACGVLGIGMLSLAKQPHAGSDAGAPHAAWIGNLFVFAAVLCEAAYAVIGKRLTSVLSPKRISAIINLWGLVLMTPMGLYLAADFKFAAVSLDIWALLLFYGVAASVWTVWLWMTGLKVVAAGRAGVFTVMLPISTAIVGVLALGERLSWLQAAAFAVALAGMLLATVSKRQREPELNEKDNE